jgi:hypothetical protein
MIIKQLRKTVCFFISAVIVIHGVLFQEFPPVNNKVSRKPASRVIITDGTSETKTEGKPKENTERGNRTQAIT